MLKGEELMVQVRRLYRVIMIILMLLLIYLLIQFLPWMKKLWHFLVIVLAPFALAAFISYLLYPITEKLTAWKLKQSVAVTIIYVVFFGITGTVIYLSFPIIIKQLNELAEQLPQLTIVYEKIIHTLYEQTAFLPEVFHDKMTLAIQQLEQQMEQKLQHILESLPNIIDYAIGISVIPVLVFYILIDYDRVKQTMYKLLTYTHLQKVDTFLQAVDRSLGGYIRGQVLVSSFVTLITFLIYHTLELKYGLLLAILMGFMNIIPYFGPILGTIPALFIALTTSWKLVVIIIFTNILIQLIENSFLSPYIMGKSVKMHPIVIILLLLVGAEIGGVVGMIVIVPLVTILKAVVQDFALMKQSSTN